MRFILANDAVRRRAVTAVADAPDGFVVRIEEPTRTKDQNSALWPILEAFSKQLKWPVNGALVYLDPSEWKTILTAAFKRESVRVAQGLDGGVVMLGSSTSKMSKRTFSEFLDFLNATAVNRGVDVYEEQTP